MFFVMFSSSSSEYLSSFSMLPPKLHIFWQPQSQLKSSKHPICDFAQEHVIDLLFEIKNRNMTVSAVNVNG